MSERRRNLITDYYDRLPAVIARCVDDPDPVSTPERFSPGFALPELDDATRRFFDVAGASWRELGEHRSHRLSMLDLTANPATNTTKTIASLLIVARAVAHIRRTGERVLIFSPTSANKGGRAARRRGTRHRDRPGHSRPAPHRDRGAEDGAREAPGQLTQHGPRPVPPQPGAHLRRPEGRARQGVGPGVRRPSRGQARRGRHPRLVHPGAAQLSHRRRRPRVLRARGRTGHGAPLARACRVQRVRSARLLRGPRPTGRGTPSRLPAGPAPRHPRHGAEPAQRRLRPHSAAGLHGRPGNGAAHAGRRPALPAGHA